MERIVLQGAKVLLPSGEVKKKDIVTKDNSIVLIADDWRKEVAEELTNAKIINCEGMFVTPGLVNAHTHAAMVLFRSYADDMALMQWLETKIWPIEAKLTEDSVYWGTQLAIAEMLRSGTTAFLDMYYFLPSALKASMDCGMRAVFSRGITSFGEAEEAEFLRYMSEAERYYGEYHNAQDGLIRIMFGPHASFTITPDYQKRVAEKAQQLGVEINIHLSETLDEMEFCRKNYNKTPIQIAKDAGLFDCGAIAAHCVHATEEDIAILKDCNVRVAHNPSSNMKLASGIAPVAKMLDAGICVAIGTDGASSNNDLDMVEETRLSALLGKLARMEATDVNAATAMKMATENGAAAIGMGDITGKIAVGYRADMVVWDINKPHWYPRHDLVSQFVYAGQSADAHTVIIDGKILMENRKLQTIDEEKLYYEVDRISDALFK